MLVTRQAVLPDVPEIHGIIQPHADAGTLLPRSVAELSENVRDFIVAEEEGRVLGCGALHLYGTHLAEIRSIAVSRKAKAAAWESAGRSIDGGFAATRRNLRLPIHANSRLLRTFGLRSRQARRAAG